jgi:queuine/archaeosine tRNA-ribosyltransferase
LQYSSSDAKATPASLTAQNQALQADLKTTRDNLSAVQATLESTKDNLSVTLTRAQSAESRLATASQVMNGIAKMVPDSIASLRRVNNLLANGEACSGGAKGKPIPGGSQMADVTSAVMNNLAAAKSAIEGISPPK